MFTLRDTESIVKIHTARGVNSKNRMFTSPVFNAKFGIIENMRNMFFIGARLDTFPSFIDEFRN